MHSRAGWKTPELFNRVIRIFMRAVSPDSLARDLLQLVKGNSVPPRTIGWAMDFGQTREAEFVMLNSGGMSFHWLKTGLKYKHCCPELC
jgi:hypothetical protein